MGARNYIDAQLNPQRIPVPPELQARLDGLATYQLSATQLYVQYGPPSFPGKDASPEEKNAARQRAGPFFQRRQRHPDAVRMPGGSIHE